MGFCTSVIWYVATYPNLEGLTLENWPLLQLIDCIFAYKVQYVLAALCAFQVARQRGSGAFLTFFDGR